MRRAMAMTALVMMTGLAGCATTQASGRPQVHVQLNDGSILHAAMQPDGLDLKPAMGPDNVQVAWASIKRMELAQTAAHQQAIQQAQAARATAANLPPAYYDNSVQKAVKAAEASGW